ncbi:MAG TPA: PAS domain S-box protein [Longimicrobium sp.]|nr:PAS domain S-box protein [Longimicrobium sp.]
MATEAERTVILPSAQPDPPPAAGPAGWDRRLLDVVEQAVIVTDPDGTIRSWNRYAETLYGWRAAEVMGRNILDVTPTSASREEGAEIMARLRAGETWSGDYAVRRRDGVTFAVHVTDTPVFDAAGELSGIVGVSYDLTVRRDAEEELRRQAEDLEDFFENASLGMHWVGHDGTILRANRAELEMLGYPAEEYIGRPIADFHADPEVIADILARLTRGETLLDYEARLKRRDGSLRHVVISSNVRFDGDGRFLHTRCLTRDVTERRRAEEEMRRLKDEAERASRAKSDFLAMMSHELRTPLNAIIGYGDLLDGEVVGGLNPTQHHHLGRITASAGYLLELIDQVLALSRIESGREEIAARDVDLAALAGDVVSLMRPLAERKELALEVDVRPGIGTARTDGGKLRQILLNLLSNAVKFTDRGRVALRARREDGAVLFAVSDTGPGIAPEHWETIFAPFTQVDQSRTRREGGSGLGLTVSRRYSALLGGDVTVESTVGRGTTFTLRLPAE